MEESPSSAQPGGVEEEEEMRSLGATWALMHMTTHEKKKKGPVEPLQAINFLGVLFALLSEGGFR